MPRLGRTAPPVTQYPLATMAEWARFWERVKRAGDDECWEWCGCERNKGRGYGSFNLDNLRCVTAHRWLYGQLHPTEQLTEAVMHTCDNPRCVNPHHLKAGTVQENNADRRAKGHYACGDAHASRRHPEKLARGDVHYARTNPEKLARGETHPKAKLTATAVITIRRMAAEGSTQRAIAQRFKVSQHSVCSIVNRRSWKHI